MDIDIYDDFNVNDLCSYIMLLEQLVANERPEDLVSAMLVQCSTSWGIWPCNWEMVIMWVYYKPVDSGYMSFNFFTKFHSIHECHVLDLQIEMNAYDLQFFSTA